MGAVSSSITRKGRYMAENEIYGHKECPKCGCISSKLTFEGISFCGWCGLHDNGDGPLYGGWNNKKVR